MQYNTWSFNILNSSCFSSWYWNNHIPSKFSALHLGYNCTSHFTLIQESLCWYIFIKMWSPCISFLLGLILDGIYFHYTKTFKDTEWTSRISCHVDAQDRMLNRSADHLYWSVWPPADRIDKSLVCLHATCSSHCLRSTSRSHESKLHLLREGKLWGCVSPESLWLTERRLKYLEHEM